MGAEECFHDVQEIWGAGEQQVRNVWSNVGCWNLCSWLYVMVELECWDESAAELGDRSSRPWDNPERRPWHRDRRRRFTWKMSCRGCLRSEDGDEPSLLVRLIASGRGKRVSSAWSTRPMSPASIGLSRR